MYGIVTICLDSVLIMWQEKRRFFSQTLEADLSLSWLESMRNRTEQDFVLSWSIWLITGIFTAYADVPENVTPPKETSGKGGKADCNFSHKIQTFTTRDMRFLQHPEEFSNAQKLRKQEGI